MRGKIVVLVHKLLIDNTLFNTVHFIEPILVLNDILVPSLTRSSFLFLFSLILLGHIIGIFQTSRYVLYSTFPNCVVDYPLGAGAGCTFKCNSAISVSFLCLNSYFLLDCKL